MEKKYVKLKKDPILFINTFFKDGQKLPERHCELIRDIQKYKPKINIAKKGNLYGDEIIYAIICGIINQEIINGKRN
jgi:hypothetical protein